MYGLALPRFAERPFEEVKVTVWRKIALLTLGIAALIGTYIVFAPLLFKLFFPIYMDAIPYTRWYALSILFAGIPPVLVSALTAHKKTKALYVSTNAPSIVLIVALLVLVPQFGLGGAIAAQIVFRLSNALITGWQFLKA
jgi:O-antigen/teichoic acid export membrane protein